MFLTSCDIFWSIKDVALVLSNFGCIYDVWMYINFHKNILFPLTSSYNFFYAIIRGGKPKIPWNGTSDISFKEMMTYVVNKINNNKYINEHLDTYDRLCSPCMINYTFIGKYLTLTSLMVVVSFMGTDSWTWGAKFTRSSTSKSLTYFTKYVFGHHWIYFLVQD